MNFKVEMRAGCVSALPDTRDRLSLLHLRSRWDRHRAAVRIKRGKTVRMVDRQIPAELRTLPYNAYCAVCKAADVRSLVGGNVNAVVKVLLSGERMLPPAEIRGFRAAQRRGVGKAENTLLRHRAGRQLPLSQQRRDLRPGNIGADQLTGHLLHIAFSAEYGKIGFRKRLPDPAFPGNGTADSGKRLGKICVAHQPLSQCTAHAAQVSRHHELERNERNE